MFDVEQPAYTALRDIISERTNRMVAWVGAGLSTPAELPSWQLLRERLCKTLRGKLALLPDNDPLAQQELAKALQKATTEENLWVAFSILRRHLKEATYSAEIKDAFRKAGSCKIPENYQLLWSFPLSGVLTLNLDRLATRAFTSKYSGHQLVEFTGKQAHDFLPVLKGLQPFVANLHGTVDDVSSWIFTHENLRDLHSNEAYIEFLRVIFLTHTVLFVGISADDVAVSGPLRRLKDLSIDFGSHYWITDRTDDVVDTWAEGLGIRLIGYRAPNGDHHQLKEMLSDLKRFVPKEQYAPPVKLEHTHTSAFKDLDPDELNRLSSEELRQHLNSRALAILANNSEGAAKEYQEFCKRFEQEIYKSWFVSTEPPNNVLLGYTLVSEIAEGAFGRVFRARTVDGENVALKLLRGEVMRKPEMLQSFRRGVQSMRILSQRNVAGMVPYRDAGEIPAFAVMDLVDGPNLAEAVDARCIEDWSSILRIACEVAAIIRAAHRLPERVLHRDIRPANIMLKGFWQDCLNAQVLVLDFDLSWHVGAMDVSIVQGESHHGYLSPEQLGKSHSVSRRNAAVDSFGFGMTLFFMRSGRAPRYMEHKFEDWMKTLDTMIASHRCESWFSIPMRFARLIKFATQDEQARRWDMSQIETELQRLRDADLHPQAVRSAELLADELASRAALQSRGNNRDYTWDVDRLQASIELVSGVSLKFIASETRQEVELQVSWMTRGDQQFQNVKKYLHSSCEKASSQLIKHGWKNRVSAQKGSKSVHLCVVVSVEEGAERMEGLCQGIVLAVQEFNF